MMSEEEAIKRYRRRVFNKERIGPLVARYEALLPRERLSRAVRKAVDISWVLHQQNDLRQEASLNNARMLLERCLDIELMEGAISYGDLTDIRNYYLELQDATR